METIPAEESGQDNHHAFRVGRQSDIQIDSISIDISSGGISRSVVEKCKHFSIRGFVSNVRKNNSKIFSPFISDSETNNNVCGEIFELQDMLVPTYRWWKCDGCLQGSDFSIEATSIDVVVPPSFTRTSANRCKDHLYSPDSSTKLSTMKEHQSSQFMSQEVKNKPLSGGHTKDAIIIKESVVGQSVGLVNGKDVSSYIQSSSPVQLLQEGYSSEQTLIQGSKARRGLADRKKFSSLTPPMEHLSGEFVSTSQGTLNALTAPSCTGVASKKCIFTALQSAEDTYLVESLSSQRPPMAPPSAYAGRNSFSSHNSGNLQGALKNVPFTPSTSPRSSKSMSSQKPIQRWPTKPCGSAHGKSGGTVMGPPKSYPDKRTSALKKLSKGKELQAGRRHNAKRVVRPQDHVKGHEIILKDNVYDVQQPTVAAVGTDPLTQRSHNEKSVAPKPKRTREFSTKRKGAINVSSDGKTHMKEQGDLKENHNLIGNEDSSSFHQCREGNAKISVEVSEALGATNITSAHSDPPLEVTNSGGSTSGHIDDDDADEDYEDEQMQGGKHLRLRRPPKIFSLRKVMDKVQHQNAEPSERGNNRKRKRKIRSKDEECIVLTNNSSQTGGSKRLTNNFHQEDPKINCKNFDSAIEVFSPVEKVFSSQMKVSGKYAPDKAKRVRTEKPDLSFMNSPEKSEPKEGHKKRPRRRNTTVEKPERSNRSCRKRKMDLLEIKEERPTASKVVQIEDEDVEIKRVKDSSPDFILAAGQNNGKLIDEKIRDATTSTSIKGDSGGKEAIENGKEKMVSDDEARGITLLSFVATGEGPSSSPKSGTQTEACGRVKDFDINVPAEEIPMDIVELMAKNQLERTSDSVSDKHIITHDPSATQTRNPALIETTSAFNAGVSRVQNPYPIAMKPPLVSDPRNGFYHTGPIGSVSQLSEYFLEVQRSRSQVSYPKDNFSSNARCGRYAPQCPDQVHCGVPYSSVGSVEPSWRLNPLAFKTSTKDITQAVVSYTQYRGGIPSLPSNSPIWSPLNLLGQGQTPIGGEHGNQGMLSSSSDQLAWPPINQRSGPLELFPDDMRKNGFVLPLSSHQRAVSEHPYGRTKQKGVHCLPPKANEPVDLSSKEAIPALQLLNLMHSTGSPSAGDVIGNRTPQYPNQALSEPDYHLYNKRYRDAPQFEPLKNISAGSRIPIYDSKGRPVAVQRPCRHSPPGSAHQFSHPLFLNNASAVNKSGGEFVNSLNFSSQDQRGTVRSSFWPSQGVTFRSETPLHPVYDMDRLHQRVSPIAKGQAAAAAPSWWSTEALNSANKPISGQGNRLVARSDHPLPTPNTQVCMVNRNPAEITDPREASKYTIQPEELRRSISKFIIQPEALKHSIPNRLPTMPRGRGCARPLKA